MNKEYLTCAETAKLVRQALKEALPGVKFGVRSKTYAGGASISIEWTDGPNEAQVKSVVAFFEGSYFDGMIDYKGNRYHTLDGKPVSMGADYIFYWRKYSNDMVARAIQTVYAKYSWQVESKPTVEDFNYGHTFNILMASGRHGINTFQQEMHRELAKRSQVAAVKASATAARVKCTGDDGYGQTGGRTYA